MNEDYRLQALQKLVDEANAQQKIKQNCF